MHVFTKIKASREPLIGKSVKIGNLFFTKSDMFDTNDTNEVMSFIQSNFPKIFNSELCELSSLLRFFDDSSSDVRKFAFACTGLSDNKGNTIFKLIESDNKYFLKYLLN